MSLLVTQERSESSDAYHEDTSVISHSAKERFRESPRVYEAEYVLKTSERKVTEAMLFGQAVHCAVLEPDVFAAGYCVAPLCDRRTNAGKATWSEFVAGSNGKAVLDAESWAMVERCRKAVMAHTQARAAIEAEGVVEKSIYWTCPETELRLKCRPDKRTRSAILDLKAMERATPDSFQRACINFGYARQQDFYTDGVWKVTGEQLPFAFIVVSKATLEIAFYELDSEWETLAARQNAETLRAMAEAWRTKDFRAAHEKQIYTLPCPRWAGYALDYE